MRLQPQQQLGRSGQGALRAVTGATLVMSYLLVVLGDTVRVTQSGMGCRSWPLCNGSIGLAGNYHAMLEQSHRYMAAIVTVLVVASFLAARRWARRDSFTYRGALFAVGFIVLQVALGALTVFAHNAGWTVALHLGGAWLVLGAAAVMTVDAWTSTDQPRVYGPRGFAYPLVAGLFLVGVSGMLVLHGGASRACPGWPLCPGASAPASLVALQYIHRSLVGIWSIAMLVVAWSLWSRGAAGGPVRWLAALAVCLVLVTALLGAVVALEGAPELAQDLHLAIASLLWVDTVVLAAKALVGDASRSPAKL